MNDYEALDVKNRETLLKVSMLVSFILYSLLLMIPILIKYSR